MIRVLIVYQSNYGQTEKIAQFLANRIKSQGYSADLLDCRRQGMTSLSNYSGVIVGAPIYARHYPRALRKWVHHHAEALIGKPAAFFSVCLAVLQKEDRVQRDLLQIAEAFFRETGWYPKRRRVFAGSLRFSKYNWFLKRFMRMIAVASGYGGNHYQDHEFTNWNDVAQFSDDFVNALRVNEGVVLDDLTHL